MRRVRRHERLPEPGGVARLELGHRAAHPLVLGEHVPHPAAQLVVQGRQRRVLVLDVSQQLDAQLPRGLLALLAARPVLTVAVGVRGPGVDHEQRQSRRLPGPTARAAATSRWQSSEQRGVGATEQRDGLVQPTGRCSGHLLLGPHAGTHQRRARRRRPRRTSASRAAPSATAHSIAAELDSPAPSGTRPSTMTSMPGTRQPASCSAHTTPAAYEAQPLTAPGPSSFSGASKGSSCCRLVTVSTSSSRPATAAYVAWGSAIGRQKQPL